MIVPVKTFTHTIKISANEIKAAASPRYARKKRQKKKNLKNLKKWKARRFHQAILRIARKDTLENIAFFRKGL